jgi:hypothetical protein
MLPVCFLWRAVCVGARFAYSARMANAGNWPVIVVEGLLVAGGALAFAWWQLRDLKKEQQKRDAAKAQQAAAAANATASPPPAADSQRDSHTDSHINPPR